MFDQEGTIRPVTTTFVFDVGETIVRDDRYWADWLDVPCGLRTYGVGHGGTSGLMTW
jgi:hypothetical protein